MVLFQRLLPTLPKPCTLVPLENPGPGSQQKGLYLPKVFFTSPASSIKARNQSPTAAQRINGCKLSVLFMHRAIRSQRRALPGLHARLAAGPHAGAGTGTARSRSSQREPRFPARPQLPGGCRTARAPLLPGIPSLRGDTAGTTPEGKKLPPSSPRLLRRDRQNPLTPTTGLVPPALAHSPHKRFQPQFHPQQSDASPHSHPPDV